MSVIRSSGSLVCSDDDEDAELVTGISDCFIAVSQLLAKYAPTPLSGGGNDSIGSPSLRL